MKKIICLVMVVCLAGLCGCGDKNTAPDQQGSSSAAAPTVSPSASPVPQKVKVVTVKDVDDGLNVRSAASTDSDVLGLAENGDTFLLLVGEAKDGWYQIQYEGKTAYVSEDYVTVKEVSVEEAAKLRGEGGSSESSSEGSSSEESSDAPDSKAPESSATTAPGVSRDSEDGEA